MPWPAFAGLGILLGGWVVASPMLLGLPPGGWAPAAARVGGVLGLVAAAAALMGSRRQGLAEKFRDSERLRQDAEADLQSYFEILPVGAMALDGEGRLLFCNAAALELLGYTEPALAAIQWTHTDLLLLKADGNAMDLEDLPMNAALRTGTRVAGVVVGIERLDDGNFAWVSLSAHPRLDEAGQVVQVLCTLEDVTSRRTAEAELTIQAFRDRLTGLHNRVMFMERLTQAILRSDRRKFSTAVLFLDLDRFKVVNDSLSHEAGDLLLVQVAKRLKGCLRPEDTVARLGGDEFAVLFEDILSVNDGLGVADRISQGLVAPFTLYGQEVFTTCSMGIAISSTADTLPSDLIRDAEVAMYRAKAKGEGSIEIFDPSMNAQALARFQMDADLRRALERKEFVLFYQPLVNLKGGFIEGWEALVRWNHPERGMVPPLDFIPLAEELGLIVPMGKWIIEEACRQAGIWQREFPTVPARLMNVNISGRQFGQRELISTVLDALDTSGLDPQCLKLEITESVMMRDPLASLEAMNVFKSKNIHLVIDDFGTGYSSLSYLKRFPVDTLKVDKSFVDGLGKDSESTAIVAAIISLAKSLDMRVTAEGIEGEDQMLHLRQLDCDQGQGYLFSRPLPPKAAEELLARNPRW